MPKMEHVCQSCGQPIAEGEASEEQSEFCTYCMVQGEFTSDYDSVKSSVADRIQEESGMAREEAEKAADERLKGLKRWQ